MLEMLASCKGSEIYPKLIEKNYSTPQGTWLQLLDKQLWETLITIHETNNEPDYSDKTHKSDMLKVGREDSNAA